MVLLRRKGKRMLLDIVLSHNSAGDKEQPSWAISIWWSTPSAPSLQLLSCSFRFWKGSRKGSFELVQIAKQTWLPQESPQSSARKPQDEICVCWTCYLSSPGPGEGGSGQNHLMLLLALWRRALGKNSSQSTVYKTLSSLTMVGWSLIVRPSMT